MQCITRLGLVAAATCTASQLACWTSLAQSTVDKDQYSLFDPVPDSAMRSFSTDRPTKSNVPYTVDAGHYQYETDVFNFSYMRSGSTRMSTIIVPNPTLKAGVTNNIDFEVNWAPLVHIDTTDSAANIASQVSGVGDVFLRTKINLWGNDGGKSAFALIPYVKAPTAPQGIGNGATEGGIIAPLSFSLGNNLTLLVNSEVDILKDSVGGGYHTGFINLVNLSGPIVRDVTLYAELWSNINLDTPRTIHQYSFDTALAFSVRSNFQIDIGANIGLNRDTPALQVYMGAAQRF
jgi:Putative MetA-pathway of phenol degradation